MKTFDRNWESFGKTNPYFGVFSNRKFSLNEINKNRKNYFFKTGDTYAKHILKIISHVFKKAHFSSGLDFGCGVGRVLIPLSKSCAKIVGVDISQSMLFEAKRNADILQRKNVSMLILSDFLKSRKKYDFVHSFIVFQHISPNQGYLILRKILRVLKKNGIGCLHFTIFKTRNDFVKSFIKQKIPFFLNFLNILRGNSFFDPTMQMYSYNLFKINEIFLQYNIITFSAEFTVHGNDLGILLFFRKK